VIAIFRSTNKVALVTGSLSGIGLGIAHSLAARGYNVVLNGFAPEEEIKNTVSSFTKKYPSVEAKFIFADLTKPQDCKNIVDETLKHFGRIDVLVNNAGTIAATQECSTLMK
jgi:3-hydroxybutyrate dehydrogenase